jgi:hypothetical protein
MGQLQQRRRTILMVENDAELRSLTVALSKTDSWRLSNARVQKLRLQPC